MATLLELKRLRQMEALSAAAGTWKEKDHPELAKGGAAHVSEMRRTGERRFEALLTRTK